MSFEYSSYLDLFYQSNDLYLQFKKIKMQMRIAPSNQDFWTQEFITTLYQVTSFTTIILLTDI